MTVTPGKPGRKKSRGGQGFMVGQRVTYVPTWCNDDSTHPACTHGVIEDVGEAFVYVNINGKTVACERSQLVIRS